MCLLSSCAEKSKAYCTSNDVLARKITTKACINNDYNKYVKLITIMAIIR